VNTSEPHITVFAFPGGLNGLEWATTVPAADQDRLVRAQADARLIEEAAETDRKYGVELQTNRAILESNTLLIQRVSSTVAALTKLPQLLTAGEAALKELLAKPPATREGVRIIDELRAALEALRNMTTPPVMTDVASAHYAQAKRAYGSLLVGPLPLDRDDAQQQE
jgi:hypothetical protein